MELKRKPVEAAAVNDGEDEHTVGRFLVEDNGRAIFVPANAEAILSAARPRRGLSARSSKTWVIPSA